MPSTIERQDSGRFVGHVKVAQVELSRGGQRREPDLAQLLVDGQLVLDLVDQLLVVDGVAADIDLQGRRIGLQRLQQRSGPCVLDAVGRQIQRGDGPVRRRQDPSKALGTFISDVIASQINLAHDRIEL